MLSRLPLLLAGLLCSLTLSASDYDVLLDASGSMRGFQNEGLSSTEQKKSRKRCRSKGQTSSGNSWKSFLGNVQKNSKKTCAFGDKYRCLEDIPTYNICLRDKNTDLAGALDSWLNADGSYKNLLIITDNVADTKDKKSLKNQDKFKELLSGTGSQFSHIAIITFRLPFNGKVFPPDSIKGKKKFSEYTGQRALVAYILGKKGTSDESFKEYRATIEEKLKRYDHEVFQVRPFETSSVKQNFGAVKFDSDESNKVSIKPVKLKNGSTAIKISNYTLGKPLDFAFDTDLEIQGAFKLKDINLESSIQFDGLPEHLTSKGHASDDVMFEAKVVPSEVTLSPNKVQGFNISFEMDRFTFSDVPFKQKLQYALSNTHDLKGRLDLLFKVTRDSYEPDKSLFREWTHDSPDQLVENNSSVQSKVYNLETILATGVANEETQENLKSIPLILEVRYTMGPIISAIILALVFLGVFYWLWLKSRSSQDYVIEDDMGGQTPLSIGLGQVYKHYDDRGRNLFSLRFLGFAYFATSRFKFDGPRMLSSEQSFEIFDKETESYHSFYLRQIDSDSDNFTGSDDSYDW